MVTWDDSWSFTVTYKPVTPKYPKAQVAYVKVREYSTGKEYTVPRSGSVTVSEERVRVIVGVKNIGEADGTLYAQVFIDSMSGTQKSATVKVGSIVEVYWDLQLTEGSHTIAVKVGH